MTSSCVYASIIRSNFYTFYHQNVNFVMKTKENKNNKVLSIKITIICNKYKGVHYQNEDVVSKTDPDFCYLVYFHEVKELRYIQGKSNT